MTIFGWMNEYPALWMIGEAIVLISVYRWWTGRQQKSSDPQEDEAEKPGIQEQPPKPDEPPEEPKRRPRSWEIKAERAQQFTVSGYPLYSSGEPSYPWTRAVGGEDRGN